MEFSSFELRLQRTDKPHCVYIVYIYCISFAKWSEAQFNFCTAKPILCTSFKTYCMLCFVDPLLHRSATGYNDQIFTFVLSNTMPHQPQNNVCAFVEGWKQLETMEIFHSFALPLLHCYGTFRSLGGALRLWSLAIQLGRQHINKII